jgi:cytochrome c oxidase assembly protein subunit 15
MVLIGYALWFGLQLLVPDDQRRMDKRMLNWAKMLLALVFIQLAFGGLMAGNKGATAAPTWPSINGSFVPEGIFQESPWTRNLVDNKLTIHFIHRGLAYLVLLLIAVFSWNLYQRKREGSLTLLASKTYWIPLALVGTQVFLGIMAVLTSPHIIVGNWGIFEWMAQLHQLVGMFLALSLLYITYLVSGKPSGKA